ERRLVGRGEDRVAAAGTVDGRGADARGLGCRSLVAGGGEVGEEYLLTPVGEAEPVRAAELHRPAVRWPNEAREIGELQHLLDSLVEGGVALSLLPEGAEGEAGRGGGVPQQGAALDRGEEGALGAIVDEVLRGPRPVLIPAHPRL